MSLESRAFWVGFLAGIGTVLLVLVVWLGTAWFSVNRNLDRIEAEQTRRGRALGAPPADTASPAEGRVLTRDWRLAGLAGDEMPYGDLPLATRVLTYWTSWCQPCQAELPHLQALSSALEGEGAEVLLFSTETPEELGRALAKRPIPLPVWSVDGIPEAIWSKGPPTTHVVDCEGRVVYSHQGAARWDEPRFVDLVRRTQASCRG